MKKLVVLMTLLSFAQIYCFNPLTKSDQLLKEAQGQTYNEFKNIYKTITLDDLRNFINNLEIDAQQIPAGKKLGLTRLKNPLLAKIYEKVLETYKKIQDEDSKAYSQSKGIYTTGVVTKKYDNKRANEYLATVILDIIKGSSETGPLLLITKSITLTPANLKELEQLSEKINKEKAAIEKMGY